MKSLKNRIKAIEERMGINEKEHEYKPWLLVDFLGNNQFQIFQGNIVTYDELQGKKEKYRLLIALGPTVMDEYKALSGKDI